MGVLCMRRTVAVESRELRRGPPSGAGMASSTSAAEEGGSREGGEEVEEEEQGVKFSSRIRHRTMDHPLKLVL